MLLKQGCYEEVMIKLYKLLFILIIVISACVFTPRDSEGACGCAITGPGQFAVVNPMANPVDRVEFTLIAPYTFGSMIPPSNWTYTLSNGDTKATFTTTVNAARINANDCLTFTLNVNNYSGDIALVLGKVEAFDKFGNKTSLDTNFAKLLANIIATPSTVANGGIITVNMTVQNNDLTKTAIVTPSALTRSNPALATLTSGPTPATLNLAHGTSGVFTWTYTAAASPASGTLTFSGSVRDAGNCLYSQWATSNAIVIGAFTASLAVTPDIVTSGNNVTVTMIVANNTGAALNNITPPSLLTTGGSATKVLFSGPTPATISALASGTSGSFQWKYTITGTSGQTYWFQGNAISGGYTTNTATSNTGQISSCSASAGSVVNNCGTYTITWTLCNNSGSSVNRIDFTIPWPWLISSVSTGLGTVATQLNPTSTTSGTVTINPASLTTGNCGTVGITFSSIPDGGTYSFPVNMQGGGCSPINTFVSALSGGSSLILTAFPASGTASSFTITAILCTNSPLSGNVSFLTDNDYGSLSSPLPFISTTACSPCTGCPACTTQRGTAEAILTCRSYPEERTLNVDGAFLTTSGSVTVNLLCRVKSFRWREVVQ